MSRDFILSCPPVGDERLAQIRQNVTRWLSAPSLAKLAESFGSPVPSGLDIYGLAEWFLEFGEVWDFRSRLRQAFDNKVGEGARWLLNNNSLTEEQKQLALAAALDLGLMIDILHKAKSLGIPKEAVKLLLLVPASPGRQTRSLHRQTRHVLPLPVQGPAHIAEALFL